MWRPSRKSSLKIHDTYSPTASFSFKDIQHLCTDDSSLKNASRVFHRVRAVNLILKSFSTRPSNHLLRADSSEPAADPRRNPDSDFRRQPKAESDVRISIPGAENSIVVYFTSLHVIRPTFENCRAVASILRTFPVRIEERDLSMDASFAAELRRIFAEESQTETPKLPRVFIGGRYVGGAEEVEQLHEIGELKKLVEELPKIERGVCEVCGDYRFVPCKNCDGSHKVYTEKLGFRSCLACNENGLVRCLVCSLPPLAPNS